MQVATTFAPQPASPHFSPGAVMIAEDFGPVYTRAQKTREGAASAVRHRHDHRHRGQTSETQELFDADKRPGEKCGLGPWPRRNQWSLPMPGPHHGTARHVHSPGPRLGRQPARHVDEGVSYRVAAGHWNLTGAIQSASLSARACAPAPRSLPTIWRRTVDPSPIWTVPSSASYAGRCHSALPRLPSSTGR